MTAWRAGRRRGERDDGVASGTTVWRGGRRGGAHDDGEGIEIEAARRRGSEEGAARREWDGGSPFRPLEMAGSYRKATEILSKSISVTPPAIEISTEFW
jgi:hypothetical protein